jgi:hypothetical protein
MMRVLAVSLSAAWILLAAHPAAAQDKPATASEELDVTMQIIVDPDAKLPDEVVRRIPLPTRKPPPASDAASGKKENDPAAKDRGNQAAELGSEMSQEAKERAQDANDQREQARRSAADKRDRERGPPSDPPPRPPR